MSGTVEIERKFMVTGDGWRVGEGERLAQGYLAAGPACSIRVRIAARQAWLTVKSAGGGRVRREFEYAIPPADAQAMLALCPEAPVEKIRYRVAHAGRTWEVDEFLGANAGLVVAEVELEDPDADVVLPDWVGDEVTEDARYRNANLAVCPWRTWDAAIRITADTPYGVDYKQA